MIKISIKSNYGANEFSNIQGKLINAATNLVNIGKFEAQKTFLLKRKSNISSSPLFSSFAIKVGGNSANVEGYFLSGGDDAFYAAYVNDGHDVYNQYGGPYGKTTPYEFMEAGLEELEKHVELELDKALGLK